MYRIKFFLTLFILVYSISCGTGYEEPDSAIEAGRQFIHAIYNGNFKRANQLIVLDDDNRQKLENEVEKDFRSRNSFTKDSLSKASIQISRITTIDSTTTVMAFTNAYHNSEAVLTVQKENGLWRIRIEKIK